MKFLRHATLDIIITAFILVVVIIKSTPLYIALAVITVLLLLARLSLINNREMGRQIASILIHIRSVVEHA